LVYIPKYVHINKQKQEWKDAIKLEIHKLFKQIFCGSAYLNVLYVHKRPDN